MINTIVRKPTKTILYGATLAAVALVITLLAVSFATGSAQAQTPPPGSSGNTDGSGDPSYTNLDTYDDPQPCGPGAGTSKMEEPHKITSGHYALFDAYWRTIEEGKEASTGFGGAKPGVGVLHTNLCPPEMVKKTQVDPETEEETVVIARSARDGGMEVDEAIMHVLDKHMATTSETNNGAGYLPLPEYPDVRDVAPEGSEVWWLQLDDPDTAADEKSDLSVGFSTLLLKEERWYTRAEGKPMRYKFEVERHPTDPGDVPHFFAYEAPKAGGAPQKDPVWDSAEVGQGEMLMSPGEFRGLQWVFTKRGTYLLWVHLLGDVKKHTDSAKDISAKDTETSEVYRYTFQVGSDLNETEPPIFGANRSVPENSHAGTKVGDPIPVYNAEADVLYYDLTGDGHGNFKLVPDTDSHTVQIVVADGANLDYETKSSYELNLTVTDRVDHEHNEDLSVDDVLIVRIDLEDQAPGVIIEVDRKDPRVGEAVNFVGRYEPPQQYKNMSPDYQWYRKAGSYWSYMGLHNDGLTWSVSQSSAMSQTYVLSATLADADINLIYQYSNEIEITWSN